MKIIIACAAICALIAVSSAAKYYPGEKGECDFRCADTKNAICAYNGQCYQKFHNECFMDHHNCIIREQKFRKVVDKDCGKYQPRCSLSAGDYKDWSIAGRK